MASVVGRGAAICGEGDCTASGDVEDVRGDAEVFGSDVSFFFWWGLGASLSMNCVINFSTKRKIKIVKDTVLMIPRANNLINGTCITSSVKHQSTLQEGLVWHWNSQSCPPNSISSSRLLQPNHDQGSQAFPPP